MKCDSKLRLILLVGALFGGLHGSADAQVCPNEQTLDPTCTDNNPCTLDCRTRGGECRNHEGPLENLTCEDNNECTTGGRCHEGVCGRNVDPGTACGDQSNNACDAPNTCNANGRCIDRIDDAGTQCRGKNGACDVADVCDGVSKACPNVFAPADTECGSEPSGACDRQDQCDGAGTCVDRVRGTNFVCREAANECDVADTCDGVAKTCRPNEFMPQGTRCGDPDDSACNRADTCNGNGACVDRVKGPGAECRADAGECDVADVCDGSSKACPNVFEQQGTACGDPDASGCNQRDTCNNNGACVNRMRGANFVCRSAAGACDVAETCSGNSTVCPADTFAPATTACTGASQGGVCNNDPGDHCAGTANSCVDAFASADTVCNPADGQCDVAETCTGSNGACPANAFAPATTACTGASQGGVCNNDPGDHCAGTANSCVDAFASADTVCNPSAGQCDVAESCTGNSGACPANVFATSTTPCTGASQGGACNNDPADHCAGTANSCVDAFASADTVCNPSAGQCDVAESCTGTNGTCPENVFAASTTPCAGQSQGDACDNDLGDRCSGTSNSCVDAFRAPNTVCNPSAGQCDVAESCTGNSGACPTNRFQSAGTVCRVADGQCDVAETCTGGGPACPVDTFAPPARGCTGSSQAGGCDNDGADHCAGTSNSCVDVFRLAGFVCRDDTGECDVAEQCTGLSGACPQQTNTDGTACNDDNICTADGTCAGGSCGRGPFIAGCKATGGGQVTTGDPWVSFGFNVQTATAAVNGQLEYNRHSNPKAAYHSVAITDLKVVPIPSCTADPTRSGRKATFRGTLRRKGAPECSPSTPCCAFEAVVEDCGEPGNRDRFTITPTGADCPEFRAGDVDRGNIQVN
jgi:hypothetical protein